MGRKIGIRLADGSFYPLLAEGFPGKRALQLNPSGYGNSKVEISLFTSVAGTMDDAQFLDRLELSDLPPFGDDSLPVEFSISLDDSQEIKMKLFHEVSGIQVETCCRLECENLSDSTDENADEADPAAVVEETEPVASVEETEPVASVEETEPVASVEETEPVASVEETEPVASVEETEPVAFVEETEPVVSVEETEPVAFVEETEPVASTDVGKESKGKKGGKKGFGKLNLKDRFQIKKKDKKDKPESSEKKASKVSSSVESKKFLKKAEIAEKVSSAKKVKSPQIKTRPPLKRKNLLDNYNFVEVQKEKVNSIPIIISVVCAVVSVLSLLVAYGFYRFGSEMEEKKVASSPPVTSSEPVTQLALVETAPIEEEDPGEIPQNQNEIVVINEGTILPQKPIQAEASLRELRYKVIWGDTLWNIAAAHYKDPRKFRKIAEYNEIKNPDYIVAGKWIVIPSN
ncbi:MAG: DUF4573 domain-containing protein [Spirochaetaceae bacterium]|nr:DUF4573 domain-containing protein [Spirochaetaceae bacterium]